MKSPSFSQWKKISKVLHKKERVVFFSLLTIALGSLLFMGISLYLKNTKVVPARGGRLIEGAVGQPRFLNPIYGETNDIDRDLTELVFSGLMTYSNQGELVGDMVKEYEISQDGRTYFFTLKDNIFWHDGRPLTSEDVVFTIRIIQNSDYKSPLRANWLEVDSEITSEKTFRLKLKSSYNSFLENCTLKIIPKHIWESILPENFALSFYNLQPVGSGPYKFHSIRQTDTGFINSLTLKANNNYYQKETNIGEIVFKFFEGKDELAKAASRKEIDSFSSTLLLDNNLPRGFTTYSFSAPRYFAVFLNNQMTDLFPKKVRDALNYATDKQDLINQLTSSLLKKYNTDSLSIADSPVLPEFFGYDPSVPPVYDLAEAENLLDSAGFVRNEEGFRVKNIDKKPAFQFKSTLKTGSTGNEVTELQKCLLSDPEVYQGDVTGYFGSATKDAVTKLQKKYLPELDSQYWGSVGKSTRAKLNEMCTPPAQNTLPLSIEITTVNQTMMVKTAEILKGQWEKAGISTSIRVLSIQDLKPIIKSREYEALLYGEALGIEPDLYPFWHSSQKIDPGLNLAVYSNDKVDSLLKEARETLDKEREGECYEQIQILIIADAPAIFLYNSAYLYSISTAIKGVDAEKLVDPSKRFANIETWFIKTKRAWK